MKKEEQNMTTTNALVTLVREAIFNELDHGAKDGRVWDFNLDEDRVDFADRVVTWIPGDVTHTSQPNTGTPPITFEQWCKSYHLAENAVSRAAWRDARRSVLWEKQKTPAEMATLSARLMDWSINPGITDPLLVKEIREAAALLSDCDELIGALRGLMKEAAAIVATSEAAIFESAGRTNTTKFIDRIREAGSLLDEMLEARATTVSDRACAALSKRTKR